MKQELKQKWNTIISLKFPILTSILMKIEKEMIFNLNEKTIPFENIVSFNA